MPVMKYVMTLALFAAAMLAAPVGHADPDPHKPDLGAHYCPGGGTVDMMSPVEPSCDGVPYDDGSYWRAINRGGPGDGSTGGCAVRQAPTAARSLRRSGAATDRTRTGTGRQLPVTSTLNFADTRQASGGNF